MTGMEQEALDVIAKSDDRIHTPRPENRALQSADKFWPLGHSAQGTPGFSPGGLHYYLIAQSLRIGAHYAYVICKGLERSGYVDFDTFRGICSLTEKGKERIEKDWLFKLKRRKVNSQKKREENKKRILKNVETIHY